MFSALFIKPRLMSLISFSWIHLVPANFNGSVWQTVGLNVLIQRTHTNPQFAQLMCANPSTINHTLTNLRHFYCKLEIIERLNDCFMQLCTLWWWDLRAETCSSWCIITLLWL